MQSNKLTPSQTPRRWQQIAWAPSCTRTRCAAITTIATQLMVTDQVSAHWPIRHSSRSTPQLAHFSQRRFDTAPSRLGAFEIRGVVDIMPTLNKYLSHDDLVSLARTSSGMRDLVQGASRQLANTIDRNNLLEYSGLLTNAELQRKLPGVLRSDYENKIGELSRQVAAQAAKAHRAIQIDSLARGFHVFNTDTGRPRALRDLRGTGVTMKLDALSRTFAVRHSL